MFLQKALNPIACELCRAKKCSPSCSQCASSKLDCKYTEGGKRGIPAAYINSLEDRLVETEAALYSALAAIDQMQSAGIAHLPVTDRPQGLPQRSKVEKQHEWKRLPLQSGDHLQRWYEQKKPSNPTLHSPLHSPLERTAHAHTIQALQPPRASCSNVPQQPQQPQHQTSPKSPASALLDHKSTPGPDARNGTLHTSAATQWRNYF